MDKIQHKQAVMLNPKTVADACTGKNNAGVRGTPTIFVNGRQTAANQLFETVRAELAG